MKRLLLGWVALLGLCMQVLAQPVAGSDESSIQLFTTVERSVAAVGEPIVFLVEVYTSPSSEQAGRDIEAAFAQARFAAELVDLELVRGESVERAVEASDLNVLKLSRRFILRAQQVGRVVLPALELVYGTQAYRTRPYHLEVYAVEPAFFEAGRSVLPVVAPYKENGRAFSRIGSAFLVAPDAVVTSFHVIMDAGHVRLRLPNGKWVRTRHAWSIDPARDVAVLYVDPKAIERAGLTPIRLAPMADAVQHWKEPATEGRVAFTNGWPGGVQRSTAGVHYSDVVLQQHAPLWISANPVRPGDSGGPLLDRYGRAIGVISAGSVLHASRDVLREEVCLTTDFRPALGQRNLLRHPRSLRAFSRDPAVMRQPHTYALRLSALLALRRYRSALVEESLEQLDALLQRTAGDPELHFVRGTIHQVYGRMEDATAAYRAALHAFEDYFPATYMLALHHLKVQNYTEAGRLFKRMEKYPPYAHLAAFGLAQAQVRRLQYEAAVAQLQAVLQYDSTFPPALFELAYCYIALGDEARARQLVARLDDVAPLWAGRLRQVLRYPVLRPFTLPELPRAALKCPPSSD